MGEQQLKNIAQRIRVYSVHFDGRPTRPVLSLPDKPSVAVLPFQNMSGDPEQEYFADGMVEDIITGLSRIRWLFVIARNSSFAYKGRAVDVKQVGRELGVHYLLEGSVRKSANRIRIAGQLIDASSGVHLWADRFEGTIEDVFELQDQVTGSVVGAIAPRLLQAEIDRASRKTVPVANQPQASMPTTYFCADWQMFTNGPGRGMTRRSIFSTKLLSEILISVRRIPRPRCALADARCQAGSSIESKRLSKPEGWRGALSNWVRTMLPYLV